MSVRITCVNKPDRFSTHESISHYGWMNELTNESGKSDRQSMVNWVKAGGSAYVRDQLGNIGCRVNRSTNDTEFLQTYADGRFSDNLLSLPECR